MNQATEDQRAEERIRRVLLARGAIKKYVLQQHSRGYNQEAASFHRVFADMMRRGVIAFDGGNVSLLDPRPPIVYPQLHRSSARSSKQTNPPFAYCPYCGHHLAPLPPIKP